MALQFLQGQIFQTPTLPDVDLTGRTIIITGANSGLGLDAAKHLCRMNCGTIILAVRSTEKGETAKQEILAMRDKAKRQPEEIGLDGTATNIEVWKLDMADHASVRAFAIRANTELQRLDGIILNAGVLLFDFSMAEELEMTITVNVVSTFLLAVLMVPILRRSGEKFGIVPHIAVTGSAVHAFANSKSLTDFCSVESQEKNMLAQLSDQSKADMKDRYFLSKLMVLLCVRQMAEQISKSVDASPGVRALIVVNNVAPGYCKTALFRDDESFLTRMGLKLIGRESEVGARTLVHGVLAGKSSHGQYLSECRVKSSGNFVTSAQGVEVGEKLWREVSMICERIQPGCTNQI